MHLFFKKGMYNNNANEYNKIKNKIKNILLVYQSYKSQDNKSQDLLNEIFSFLKSFNKSNFEIKCNCIERDSLKLEHYRNIDLVLVLGGDGTFLRTSHLNINKPMLGINPNPEKKEGFYMQSKIYDYKDKLIKVFQNNYKIIKLLRLGVKINSKKIIQKVLNEVYIGDSKPYNVFNYIIKIKTSNKNIYNKNNNKNTSIENNLFEEFQRSSGFLIGTPSGSHAWISSSGGIKQEIIDNKFQFIARELYEGKLTKNYKLKNGLLNPEEKIIIIPKSKGILVIDSISSEYKLNIDDEIEVFVDEPLNYVVF